MSMSMAHRTTQRRTLAGTDSKKVLSMDPTLRKHPKPMKPNPDPAPIIPSKPSVLTNISSSMSNKNTNTNNNNNNYLSKSLNSSQSHKVRTPQKPASQINPLLRAKAMSVSAIVDYSSKYSLSDAVKPNKASDKEEEEKGRDKVVSLKGFEEEHKKKKSSNNLGGGQRHLVSSSPLVGGNGGCGRRRSFGGSHVELADVFANNGVKVVSVDMPPSMQIHAVELARKVHDSLEKFTSKTLALTLKKEFDGIYGPAWHCIVGTSFGSFVTHSVGGFLYFSMDQKLYILLFKTTVQRAD